MKNTAGSNSPLVNIAFPSAILKRLLYFLSGSADAVSDHQVWRPSGPAFFPFQKIKDLCTNSYPPSRKTASFLCWTRTFFNKTDVLPYSIFPGIWKNAENINKLCLSISLNKYCYAPINSRETKGQRGQVTDSALEQRWEQISSFLIYNNVF